MRTNRFAAALSVACFLAPGLWAPNALARVADKAEAGQASPDPAPRWLDPATFAPQRAFAPPPTAGSLEERLDLDRLRALIAASTPQRRARADWDGQHEEVMVFSAAAGRDLTALPATMDLLLLVQDEVERVVVAAKHHYRRPRPFMVDPALPHCGKGENALKAYPSGHAAFGWSVGWVLASLLPERAPALLERAQDYGLSREICGVHYATDIAASQSMATAAAEALLSDPRLAAKVAAARAELVRP
ncbi:MAG: hypothetical protein RIS94_2054 [Pseudomonadota bacterium]|jgi:acid phosphatase (class A)